MGDHFKSAAGRAAVIARYDAIVQRAAIRPQSLFVETRHGTTHVLAAGSPESPPVVLLHGRAVNAVIWLDYMANLCPRYRVFAPDVIGEPGKSAPNRPSSKGAGFGEWLVDLFDGLKIERAAVIGMSFGGWLALKLALSAPGRLTKLVLLCPAGFTHPEIGFIARGIAVSLFPNPTFGRHMIRFFSAPTVPVDNEMVEILCLLARNYRPNIEAPHPFSDSALRRITLPTLLMIGAYDRVFKPQPVIQRACSVVPGIVAAHIIPNAGHNLIYDQPAVFPQIADFLKNDPASNPGV